MGAMTRAFGVRKRRLARLARSERLESFETIAWR